MIKKLLLTVGILIASIGGLFTIPQAFGAQPPFTVFQGGTGTSSPSGILIGDNGATPRLKTLTIGSNLTLTGTTLSATGGGSVGTSTHEAANQVAVFSTNSATPALLGGDSGLTFAGDILRMNNIRAATDDLTIGSNANEANILFAQDGSLTLTSSNGRDIHFYNQDTAKDADFDLGLLTTNRAYNFPDADGTFCLTTTCTGSLFPFTPTTYGNSTSTTIGFLNGLLSTASSTFSNIVNLTFPYGLYQNGSQVFMSSSTAGNTIAGYHAGYHFGTSTNSFGDISGNTAYGYRALELSTSSVEQTAYGAEALANFIGSDTGITAAGNNTAMGFKALYKTTTGFTNAAFGDDALALNTTGDHNTGLGGYALFANTVGITNTAVGANALQTNTTGSDNTSVGDESMFYNLTGAQNTAVGKYAMVNLVNGGNNVAIGYQAMKNNITGSSSIAIGRDSLFNNVSPTTSVAIGYAAGFGGATYDNQGDTYVGYAAGNSVITGSDYNTLIGNRSGQGVTSGANNTLVGASNISGSQNQVTTGSQNISIGYNTQVAVPTTNGQLDIGNFIYGTGLTGTGVTVSSGKIGLGTTTPASLLELYGSNTNTTLATFGDPALSITNSNTTDSNFESLAFRSVDTNGAEFSTARISGINTSHTAGATTGDLAFLTNNAGTLSERGRITSAGNFGYGTTTPTQGFEVLKTNILLKNTAAGFGIFVVNNNAGFGSGATPANNATVNSTFSVGSAYRTVAAPTNSGIIQNLFGIGTSSPFARLSIHANPTDTFAKYLFAIASSTSGATTTLLTVDNTGTLAVHNTATSTFDAGISATYLNLTGTSASSTASNGINITGGCYAINGICLAASTNLLPLNNIWTGTNTFGTTTMAAINGVVVVDGVRFAQTGAGVQSAINTACNGTTPGTVYFPAATYLSPALITYPNNCELYGSKYGTIFQKTGSDFSYLFQNVDTVNGGKNVKIHDFTILGLGATPPTGIGPAGGIQAVGMKNIEIYNIFTDHVNDVAIDIISAGSGGPVASTTNLHDNDCTVNDGACIQLGRQGGGTIFDTVVQNNRAAANDSGIALFTSSSTKILTNTIQKKGSISGQCIEISAVDATGTNAVLVQGNHCYNSPNNGLYVTENGNGRANDIQFKDNITEGNATFGIFARGTDVSTIGNTAKYNGQAGIVYYAANSYTIPGGLIQNNICSDNGTSGVEPFGILLRAESSGLVQNVTVMGNTCTDDQATKTQKSGIALENTTGAGANNQNHNINNNFLTGNASTSVYLSVDSSALLMYANSGATSSVTTSLFQASPSGSASAPAYSFLESTNTGMFMPTPGLLEFSSGGTTDLQMDGTNIYAPNANGFLFTNSSADSTSVPTLRPDRSSSNTGFAAGTAGNLNAIVGGSEITRWTSIGMGVGTTVPAQLFSVGGNGYFTGGVGIGVANTTAGSLNVSGAIIVGTGTLGGGLQVNNNDSYFGTGVSGSGAFVDVGNLGDSSGVYFDARGSGSNIGVNLRSKGTGDITLLSAGGGTSLAIFKAAGNFGIGTTTPGSLLSVNGIANFTPATSTFYGTGGINLTGGGCFAINGTCITGGTSSNASSTLLADFNKFTGQNMFLATTTIGDGTLGGGLTISGGATSTNVGHIAFSTSGTNSPFLVLQNTHGSTNDSAYLSFGVTNTQGSYQAAIGDIRTNLPNSGDSAIVFQNFNNLTGNACCTVAAERMRVDGSGNVGIGSSSPFALLSIHSNPNQSTINPWLFAIGSSTQTSTSTLFTVANTGQILNNNGDVFTSVASYVVSTTTATGNFTDVQSAINALGANPGTIIVRCGTYTLPTGNVGINFKNSGQRVIGSGKCTQFNFDKANTTQAVGWNVSDLENTEFANAYIHQTNATFGGFGVDASNTPLVSIHDLKIDGTATATMTAIDNANITFYQHWYNLDMRDNTSCIQIGSGSSNPVNDNTYDGYLRCAMHSGNNGFGLYVDANTVNGSQAIKIDNFNSEPTGVSTGLTAIKMINAVDITLTNPYVEGNAIGWSLGANTQRINFIGGEFLSNTTYTNSGSNNQWLGVDKESLAYNLIEASSTIADVSGNDAAVPSLAFIGNGNFAKVAPVLSITLANGTDSGQGVKVTNPGTGAGLWSYSSGTGQAASTTGKVFMNALGAATGKNAVCVDSVTGQLDNAGNTTCATSSFFTKQDIQPLTLDALAETMKLSTVQFAYKDSPTVTHYGLIAEDVQKVDPLLVNHATAVTKLDGHTFQIGDPYAIDSEHLTDGLLVKDIQQLQNEVQALQRFGIAAKRSAEENWQWVAIALLVLWNIGLTVRRRK